MDLLKKHKFLFEELVKRDFKKKYKGTVLGMFWSILSPLLMLVVMAVIFGQFFGRDTPYYIVYLFSGQVVFNYFTESTNEGMKALKANAGIFSKINAPKYLFLFSKNVSALINFCIILLIYFASVLYYGITPTFKFFLLIYPIVCLIIMNLGIGLILSALFIFFKDIEYLYRIFTRIIMYGSAIFYTVDRMSPTIQKALYLNPVYDVITYFRTIVIHNTVPSLGLHCLIGGYSIVLFAIGFWVYKKNNYKFIYYI